MQQVNSTGCFLLKFYTQLPLSSIGGSACVLFKLWQVPPLKLRHHGGIQMQILYIIIIIIYYIKKPGWSHLCCLVQSQPVLTQNAETVDYNNRLQLYGLQL